MRRTVRAVAVNYQVQRRPLPIWVAVVGISLLVVLLLGGVYYAASHGASDPVSPEQHDQYVRDRAYCEQVATAQLPPQYKVGGPHWADMVNSCLIDRG